MIFGIALPTDDGGQSNLAPVARCGIRMVALTQIQINVSDDRRWQQRTRRQAPPDQARRQRLTSEETHEGSNAMGSDAMRSAHVMSAIILAAMLAWTWTAEAAAAAVQLDCTLTDTAEQLGSVNRAIVVIFDQAAKTLKARAGSHDYDLGNVSISNVAMSGDVDDISIGIDRSSLGIVWQQYGGAKPAIQFGQCRQAAASTTAHAP